jgi:DNA-binding transcriptional ArsR family regulator
MSARRGGDLWESGRGRATGPADLDRVFKALASGARREVLDALREGPKTTGDLVMLFPGVSRFAVMQHLKVLRKARLVVSRRVGREKHQFLNVIPISQVYERWVSRYEGLWAGALTGLARRAEAVEAAESVGGVEAAEGVEGVEGVENKAGRTRAEGTS